MTTVVPRPERGIDTAVRLAGSQVELGKLLGCTQQNVSTWVKQGWVPTDHLVAIEAQLGVPRRALINPRLADLLDAPTDGGAE
jgi:DNA-binding transcriptional regulator YdaS (Cro superfamily)